MDPAELKNMWEAIKTTKELFEKRKGAQDWQRNIVDGSRNLKTKCEWANYYSWLSNPSAFVPKEESQFLFEEEDNELWKNYKYPAGVYEKRYKNGNETVIHIVNEKWHPKQGQNEEKTKE